MKDEDFKADVGNLEEGDDIKLRPPKRNSLIVVGSIPAYTYDYVHRLCEAVCGGRGAGPAPRGPIF